MIRELRSAMEREKAPPGVFPTLAEPSKPRSREASAIGVFHSEAMGRSYPRLQIIPLAGAVAGKRPDIPWVDPSAAFKRAVREPGDRQARLL